MCKFCCKTQKGSCIWIRPPLRPPHRSYCLPKTFYWQVPMFTLRVHAHQPCLVLFNQTLLQWQSHVYLERCECTNAHGEQWPGKLASGQTESEEVLTEIWSDKNLAQLLVTTHKYGFSLSSFIFLLHFAQISGMGHIHSNTEQFT